MNKLPLGLSAVLLFAFNISPPTATSQNQTATIEGSVTILGTMEGIEGVRISVLGGGEATLTDDHGHFILKAVAPGSYIVRAQRDGYGPRSVSADPFATANPNFAITRVTVASGQTVRDIALHMVPWGVISGRIVDSSGKPVSGADIATGAVSYADGVRKVLCNGRVSKSNDRGEYRLAFVSPGENYVCADPPNTSSGTGSAFRRQLEARGGTGPNGIGGGNRGAAPPEPSMAMVRTYFPSGLATDDAKPVQVAEGGTIAADIVMRTDYVVTISGEIAGGTNLRDLAAGQFVLVSNSHKETEERTIANSATGPSGGSGIPFELRGIPPGDYDIYPVIRNRPNSPAEIAAQAGIVFTSRNRLEIDRQNINELQFTILPPVTLSGNIAVLGGGSGPDTSSISIQLHSLDGVPRGVMGNAGQVQRIDAKGGFEIQRVPEGEYFLTHSDLPPGYFISDIQQGTTSISQKSIRVGSRSADSVKIMLSPGAKVVEGTIHGIEQSDVTRSTAVLIPDDPNRANRELYTTSSIDLQGRFQFNNVAPGKYELFAWDSIPLGAYLNAAFVSEFKARGVPVTVDAGGAGSVGVTGELIVRVPQH